MAKLAFEADNPSLHFPPHIPGDLQDLIINLTQKRVEDRAKDINEILTILKTNASLSHELPPDTEETVFFSQDRASTQKTSSPTHTVLQSPSSPTQIQPQTPSKDSTNQPPSNNDLETP